MNKSCIRVITSFKWFPSLAILLGAMLCGAGLAGVAQTEPAPDQKSLRAAEARQNIQETGQAALNKIQLLWQRIDERRLRNRTADELVAWVIMGLLVGGLLYRFGGRSQLMSVILGLVGAFIGGIVAHVAQLDLGLGPVLITYEDLLCTLAGGVLMLCGVRWSSLVRLVKPRV